MMLAVEETTEPSAHSPHSSGKPDTHGLVSRYWRRFVVGLAIAVVGVVFFAAFRLPPHLIIDTGSPGASPAPASGTLIQPLGVVNRSRVTAVEVLLSAAKRQKSVGGDRLTVYDDAGTTLGTVLLAPGAVTDKAYWRAELDRPLLVPAGTRFYVVLSSDARSGRSAAAWTTDTGAQNSFYSLPGGQSPSASIVTGLQQARAREGSLCVRVYGLGGLRLRAESAARVAGLIIALLLAVAAFFFRPLARQATRCAAAVRDMSERTSERFAASPLSRPGRAVSEKHLVRFDLKTQVLCLAGLVVFVVLVAGSIHFSSIEMWNSALPAGPGDANAGSLLLGKPKSIRSDEWLVSTPATLHDYAQPSGASLQRRALDLASPWKWGFYAFGVERGFALMWDFWYLGAFFSFFFLMLLLTKNDFAVSVFSGLVVLFSAYNRWWDMTMILTTFSMSAVSLVYLLQARKVGNIVAGFVLLCVFAQGFVVAAFYPAWQVTLGYLGLFIVVGFLVGNDFRTHLREHFGLRIALILTGVAGAAGAALAGYNANQVSFRAMMDTVYPGRRVSTGGDVGLYGLFSGYLDPLFSEGSSFLVNICESSSFFLLYPVVLVALVVQRATGMVRQVRPPTIAVAVYLLLLTFYILIGFDERLARLTAVSYAPGYRAVIGLGIAGIVLTGLYLREEPARPTRAWVAALVGTAAFAVAVAFAYGFGQRYASPTWSVNWYLALPVCVVLAVAVTALVMRARPVFFVAMLLLVVVPSIGVIPVSTGLAPIYQKALVRKVEQVVATDPNGRWLVYGSWSTPEIVRAAGADVFNGVRFPPETRTLRMLDPLAANESVWNRYAHITAQPADRSSSRFNLDVEDTYTLTISPEDPNLAAAGVRYFVAPPDASHYFPTRLFRKLNTTSLNGYSIYERVQQ